MNCCDRNECFCVIVWQTDSSELRRNWIVWESKNPLHSTSCYLLWLYWLMCLECSWIDCKSKYVPSYQVQFWFQCKKQSINQPTAVRWTAGYDELRWTSVSNKLSPRLHKAVLPGAKCSLSAVAAVCWYLFEWFDGVVGRRGEEQNIIFSEQLQVNPALLTEWR